MSSVIICQNCRSNGRPKNKQCVDCRVLHLEAQNNELIERLNAIDKNPPQPKEQSSNQECKECESMADRINQLSQLLHESYQEKEKIMKDFQEQYDKLMSINNNILDMHACQIKQEEDLKKTLQEKEVALEVAIKEEQHQKAQERLNKLAAPLKRTIKQKVPSPNH